MKKTLRRINYNAAYNGFYNGCDNGHSPPLISSPEFLTGTHLPVRAAELIALKCPGTGR